MTCSVCSWKSYSDSHSATCTRCGWPHDEADLGLDEIPEPTAPKCREALENAPFEEDNGYREPPIADELRSMDNPPRDHLVEAGYHSAKKGICVTNPTAWKRKRKHVTDTRLYDYLLRDAVDANMCFWQAYHWEKDRDTFIENAINGEYRGSDSEENIARTYRWLVDVVEAPTELAERQATIGEW